MSIRALHQEHGAGDRRAGIGVVLPDGQVGPLVILQTNRGIFTGEQLHMILCRVQDMVRYCGNLLQGIDARFQALPGDLSCAGGDAIQISRAVLDLGQPVGDAAQWCPIRTLFV